MEGVQEPSDGANFSKGAAAATAAAAAAVTAATEPGQDSSGREDQGQ